MACISWFSSSFPCNINAIIVTTFNSTSIPPNFYTLFQWFLVAGLHILTIVPSPNSLKTPYPHYFTMTFVVRDPHFTMTFEDIEAARLAAAILGWKITCWATTFYFIGLSVTTIISPSLNNSNVEWSVSGRLLHDPPASNRVIPTDRKSVV